MTVSWLAPQSSGNFIVGFDCLGAALRPLDDSAQGDVVSVSAAARDEFHVSGPYAAHLPTDSNNNLVIACRDAFNALVATRDVAPQPLCMTLDKRLPIGSGLGSSAASIVAALAALNDFYSLPLAQVELLQLCGEMEARVSGGVHFDNVAPSLLGGLQLMLPDPQRLCLALPVPDWTLVLCYPGIKVETRAAREVLPAHYRLEQVTQFAQRLSSFVASLQQGDYKLAASLMRDELVEPHRAALVPGFYAAQTAAMNAGASAFSLSGSGPTCLAICENGVDAERVRVAIVQAFPAQPGLFSFIGKIDAQGARTV